MAHSIPRTAAEEGAYFRARAASHERQAIRAAEESQRALHTRFAQLYAAQAALFVVELD